MSRQDSPNWLSKARGDVPLLQESEANDPPHCELQEPEAIDPPLPVQQDRSAVSIPSGNLDSAPTILSADQVTSTTLILYPEGSLNFILKNNNNYVSIDRLSSSEASPPDTIMGDSLSYNQNSSSKDDVNRVNQVLTHFSNLLDSYVGRNLNDEEWILVAKFTDDWIKELGALKGSGQRSPTHKTTHWKKIRSFLKQAMKLPRRTVTHLFYISKNQGGFGLISLD